MGKRSAAGAPSLVVPLPSHCWQPPIFWSSLEERILATSGPTNIPCCATCLKSISRDCLQQQIERCLFSQGERKTESFGPTGKLGEREAGVRNTSTDPGKQKSGWLRG